MNIYLNGQGMGKHSDSEKDIVEGSTIASVPLGTVAQMIFTNIASKDQKVVWLTPGSLLLMNKHTQRYWKHEIVPNDPKSMPRISLVSRALIKQKTLTEK